MLVASDHPNTLSALLSFVLSQNIDGIMLDLDESDRTSFLREIALLLLPCSKERAAAFLASSSSMQMFSGLSLAAHKRAPKFDWTQVCVLFFGSWRRLG